MTVTPVWSQKKVTVEAVIAIWQSCQLIPVMQIYEEFVRCSFHCRLSESVIHVLMFVRQNLNEDQLKPLQQPSTGCVYNKDDYLVFMARGFNQRHLVSQLSHPPPSISMTTIPNLMLMMNESSGLALCFKVRSLSGWNVGGTIHILNSEMLQRVLYVSLLLMTVRPF